MESNLSLNTLVHGNAENLAGRCCTEVRDVEVAIRTEGHTGRSWEAGSGREFERVEETIRAEIDGDNCGEAGARSREAKLLELVAAAKTEEEGPGACAGVEAHDLA